jgi:hypothetical protein
MRVHAFTSKCMCTKLTSTSSTTAVICCILLSKLDCVPAHLLSGIVVSDRIYQKTIESDGK